MRALTRLRASGSQRGLSLAELIVVIALFAVISAMVGGMFVSLSRATTTARTIDSNVRNASNGMNELSRIIRAGTNNPAAGGVSAPAFSYAGPEQLTIFAYVNLKSATTVPVQVTFAVDADRRLFETTTTLTADSNGYYTVSAGSVTTTRYLTSSVAAATTPALFTYYKTDGTPLPATIATPLSAADRALVASVTVTLNIKQSATSQDLAVQLVNSVGIPNLTNGALIS